MRILAVGIATLYIINTVDGYPAEDQEVRASAQRVARGGNATNTLVVLSQLGHDCEWGGVLGDDPDSEYVLTDLQSHRIGTEFCETSPGGKTPTSYIVLSTASGSRTIVHFRDLPEYSADAFAFIDLEHFDWIHFEGRNIGDLTRMLHRVNACSTPCSLEVEKRHDGIEELFELPDLLLFSRDYALQSGFSEPEAFLRAMRGLASPGVRLFCAWGDEGAAALDSEGAFLRVPASAPSGVRDTLGAGDVFNAAVIDGQLRGLEIGQILSMACELAGRKCARSGLSGLV
ncbi:MAG: ketohexokinase [gamma proteobacterium symbiont of Phacoides pectinatus]